jgi:O-antigen/teichoic acid export membrane protein
LTEVGVYNVVLPSALIILFFSRALSQVFFPISSELIAKNEKAKLLSSLSSVQKYAFLCIVPAVSILLIFPDIFLNILFGEAYAAGALALQILLIGIMFFALFQISSSVLSGMGKPKDVTKVIVIAALFNILINLILIPLIGMTGAAIATSISYILAFVLITKKLSKRIGFHVPWLELIKTLASGGIFIFTIFLLKTIPIANIWIKLLIILPLALAVYLITILLLKITNKKEITWLLKRALKS